MHYSKAMKNLILILLIVAGFCVQASCHPIKMSTGKLSYDRESKKIILTINFFADDFGAYLQKIYRLSNIEFSNPTSMLHDVVEDYVKKKFTIKVNTNKQLLVLESLTKSEDNVVQAKFSISETAGYHITVLEIYDELLFEAFKDQVNVLNVDIDKKEGSKIFRFSPGDTYVLMKMDFICH